MYVANPTSNIVSRNDNNFLFLFTCRIISARMAKSGLILNIWYTLACHKGDIMMYEDVVKYELGSEIRVSRTPRNYFTVHEACHVK